MNPKDPIIQAWRDATNRFLASKGLPKLKEPLPEGIVLCESCSAWVDTFDLDQRETFEHNGCCKECNAKLGRNECPDPRKGVAEQINRRIG